jgi:hypothetical protein
MIDKSYENKNLFTNQPDFRELVNRIREFVVIQPTSSFTASELLSEVREIIQEAPSLKMKTLLALSFILCRSRSFLDGTGLPEEIIVNRVCSLTRMEREDAEIMVPVLLSNLPHARSIDTSQNGLWKEP